MDIIDIGIVFKARIVRIQASLKALYTYTNKRKDHDDDSHAVFA